MQARFLPTCTCRYTRLARFDDAMPCGGKEPTPSGGADEVCLNLKEAVPVVSVGLLVMWDGEREIT